MNIGHEWGQSREDTTHVTLTRPPETRTSVAVAALKSTAGRIAVAVAVLLVLGTYVGLEDVPLGALALAGGLAVFALGVRDIRRTRRVHRS